MPATSSTTTAINDASVQSMGVRIHAKRPSFPMIDDVVGEVVFEEGSGGDRWLASYMAADERGGLK